MNVLIKKATVVAPGEPLNGKTIDILIEGGVIKSIKSKISNDKNLKEIEAEGLHVSSGWIDLQANFCDPGMEHKEDIESGIKAAVAGGFTGVAVVPSTQPPLHTKAQIEYIKNKTKNALVDIYPLGALSQNVEGKDIAEMYDMHLSGAAAFTDDKKAVSDSGLLMRALLYSKNFNGKIFTHCDEKGISQNGQINEGEMSVRLGFKGIPALAEELMLSRNLFLAEYTDAPIHISNVSTAKSADLIKQAKNKGIKVTASVNVFNLSMSETLLSEFDTNYKLNPPLRTAKDVEALQKAVADGTVDVITSDHRPQDIESKAVEFDHASNGMISLQTAYALLNTSKAKLKTEDIIRAFTDGPSAVLGIPKSKIEEGVTANLTLFAPETEWVLNENDIKSKSKNTALIGKKLKGKVVAVINNNQLHVNK